MIEMYSVLCWPYGSIGQQTWVVSILAVLETLLNWNAEVEAQVCKINDKIRRTLNARHLAHVISVPPLYIFILERIEASILNVESQLRGPIQAPDFISTMRHDIKLHHHLLDINNTASAI